MIQFNATNVSEMSKDFIGKVLDSNCLSEGETVKEFETELQNILHLVRKPVAVNSGTSALHLAVVVAGIQEGDEVILPAQTFIATGLPILMQKAKPVFADIQPDTGNICPQSIRQKITPKTKAIMPVHWCGYPCDLDEIHEIAKEHQLVVIEDAAHAIGASYKGKMIGSISQFTCYSFQAIKHLTTGDGGAVCCLTSQHESELLKKRWFNIDRERDLPSILGERIYNSEDIGFKYHMNNITAALGLANLLDLPKILERHRSIGCLYRQQLQRVSGLSLLSFAEDRESSYWRFTVLVEKREQFIRALASRGVPTSIINGRIDKNKIFGGITPGLVGQELFEEKHVALPLHNALTEKDVSLVIESIKRGW
ncbi:MAG: DegT/DnrJ/EryC1/StrS family aminotransferase [Chlamydiales bacterium]|nr:DegT/DnrJ/EryC1/StrS family aminotransferase [Chlamydiales bacterium]